MIIWSLTVILQSIYQLNVQGHLFEGLKHCLYTLKHISSFSSHISSSWLFIYKQTNSKLLLCLSFLTLFNWSVATFCSFLFAINSLQHIFSALTFPQTSFRNYLLQLAFRNCLFATTFPQFGGTHSFHNCGLQMHILIFLENYLCNYLSTTNFMQT